MQSVMKLAEMDCFRSSGRHLRYQVPFLLFFPSFLSVRHENKTPANPHHPGPRRTRTWARMASDSCMSRAETAWAKKGNDACPTHMTRACRTVCVRRLPSGCALGPAQRQTTHMRHNMGGDARMDPYASAYTRVTVRPRACRESAGSLRAPLCDH